MKWLAFLSALCLLCSCSTLRVSQVKNKTNTPAIGVEWSFGNFKDEGLQQKIDSTLLIALNNFNSEKHSFTVYQRKGADKRKDYITLDLRKGKVVSKGEKIAGYSGTAIGLVAMPATLIALESPLFFAFYLWPNHHVACTITLSPALSSNRKNKKGLTVMTGALFASTERQVNKLAKKYEDEIHKALLDIEVQLNQHR